MKRILACLALSALAACGAPAKTVEVKAPDSLYRQLEDPLPRVDRTLLSGHRIIRAGPRTHVDFRSGAQDQSVRR